jgi:hypothetical protein
MKLDNCITFLREVYIYIDTGSLTRQGRRKGKNLNNLRRCPKDPSSELLLVVSQDYYDLI